MAHNTLEDNRPAAIRRQAGYLPAIEATLADFLARQVELMQGLDPAVGAFARIARDLVLSGGKRMRPTFAYWGWRGFAGPHEPVEPLLPALAALELMHTFALMHDDVMDRSTMRRGVPTAHQIFAGRHAAIVGRGDSERFGTTSAILAGDLCLVWADQLLACARIPAATLFDVRSCYDSMRIEAVAGQYLDVLSETMPESWSIERALLVARNKTASYTVRRPLQFGLALAGAERAAASPIEAVQIKAVQIEAAYGRYGVAIGEAFQLRDDLLGTFGDPRVTGKPADDDVRSGKPTTLLMLALQLATPAQRAELVRDTVGDPAGLDHQAGAGRLAEIIAQTGAPARVEELIRERVASGLTALDDAPIDPDARAALTDLAVAAANRPT